jgi:hypothetical protein
MFGFGRRRKTGDMAMFGKTEGAHESKLELVTEER